MFSRFIFPLPCAEIPKFKSLLKLVSFFFSSIYLWILQALLGDSLFREREYRRAIVSNSTICIWTFTLFSYRILKVVIYYFFCFFFGSYEIFLSFLLMSSITTSKLCNTTRWFLNKTPPHLGVHCHQTGRLLQILIMYQQSMKMRSISLLPFVFWFILAGLYLLALWKSCKYKLFIEFPFLSLQQVKFKIASCHFTLNENKAALVEVCLFSLSPPLFVMGIRNEDRMA